jgi:hypothetical protein
MVPESSCLVTVEIVTRVFLSGQLFCLCELEYVSILVEVPGAYFLIGQLIVVVHLFTS